jgi:hypothetical protein
MWARFCETCKHMVQFYNCGRKLRYFSVVDGEKKYKPCYLEREGPHIFWWNCGPRGRFWEYDSEGKNPRAIMRRKEEKLDQMLANIKTKRER